MKLFYILVSALLIVALLLINETNKRIEKNTEFICSELAEIRKADYRGTKWQDMDFYEVCIHNATCTSPLKNCK